jgi:hypothetical protein
MATYSFLDVVASITGPGGTFSLGNGAGPSEEGITIDMVEAKNTMTIGADGSVMHSLHAGKGGTVTVRYLKTTPANAQLQAMYDLQTTSSALHGINVIVVANPVSGDVTTCRNCAFQKKTALTYAKDGGTNEWVFDAGQVDTVLGTGYGANQ